MQNTQGLKHLNSKKTTQLLNNHFSKENRQAVIRIRKNTELSLTISNLPPSEWLLERRQKAASLHEDTGQRNHYHAAGGMKINTAFVGNNMEIPHIIKNFHVTEQSNY